MNILSERIIGSNDEWERKKKGFEDWAIVLIEQF